MAFIFPKTVPEFENPPINELALGVQFQAPPAYGSIFSGQIYETFRADFPIVQEQPPIQPVFETFGAVPNGGMFSFNALPVMASPRYWFIDKSGHQLLQLQSDKFLHNWRQLDGSTAAQYPRFEAIFDRFSDETKGLERSFQAIGLAPSLLVNQAEISYYNRFYGDAPSEGPRPDKWLTFLRFGDRVPEGYNGIYREVILDGGVPIGRLYLEVNSGTDNLGRKMIVYGLTFRGPPKSATIDAALEVIAFGRNLIAKTFAETTTEEAQATWKRIR